MSKICNVCGSMNNDTQQTCAVCGSALIQASAPEQPKIKYPIYENTDYAAIAARYYHTVGLKEDGSVVAVGRDNGECDVDDWTDIFTVAMDRLD